MIRRPFVNSKHRICIICEGFEEFHYIKRLLELNVWNENYEFIPINVKSASNIFPRYQDAYSNAKYEVIIIFCDTDRKPFREYYLIKDKINKFHNNKLSSDNVIIFANPCTMLIILSHFDDVYLTSQAKKVNAPLVFRLTGIDRYDAKEEQIKKICNKIYRRNYIDMKKRIIPLNKSDENCNSTNFIKYINYFENDDLKWINDINKLLEKNI